MTLFHSLPDLSFTYGQINSHHIIDMGKIHDVWPTLTHFVDRVKSNELADNAVIQRMTAVIIKELLQNLTPYDLRLNAAALANRDILLIGGWDDVNVTIEHKILPFYRALVEAKARNVQIVAFQDDHSFERSRDKLATLIIHWVKSHNNAKVTSRSNP